MKTISIFFIQFKYCMCIYKSSRLHFFCHFKTGLNMLKKAPSKIYKKGKFLRWDFYYCYRGFVLECIRDTNNDNVSEKNTNKIIIINDPFVLNFILSLLYLSPLPVTSFKYPICCLFLLSRDIVLCVNKVIGIF
jgi:hypothetical protein